MNHYYTGTYTVIKLGNWLSCEN